MWAAVTLRTLELRRRGAFSKCGVAATPLGALETLRVGRREGQANWAVDLGVESRIRVTSGGKFTEWARLAVCCGWILTDQELDAVAGGVTQRRRLRSVASLCG